MYPTPGQWPVARTGLGYAGETLSVLDVIAGSTDLPLCIFQGIAQAVVETLPGLLKLQTMKGPGLVIPDVHLPSFAQIETVAGHGRRGEDLAMVRSVASQAN